MALGLFAPFVKLRPQWAPERLESFGCQMVPVSSTLAISFEGKSPRMDVRHIREGLGTKFCSITRVAEAADGLRGQKMNANAFDYLEETPFLPLSSALS